MTGRINRYVLTLDLRDDPAAIAAYRQHHAQIWPEVVRSLEDAGVRHLEIHLLERRLVMIVELEDGLDLRQRVRASRGVRAEGRRMGAADEDASTTSAGRSPGRVVGPDGTGLPAVRRFPACRSNGGAGRDDVTLRMTGFRQAWNVPTRPRPIVLIGAGAIVRTAHLPAYRRLGLPIAGLFDLDRQVAADDRAAVRRARRVRHARGGMRRRQVRRRRVRPRGSRQPDPAGAALPSARRAGADPEADGGHLARGARDPADLPRRAISPPRSIFSCGSAPTCSRSAT